ncbi:MAG: cation transporter [Gemmatimonadota bacterium]|nr:cation transporter [Gemmatimonadota bacterium]MDH4348508.1 cation transporter [Gemmatimonadota bacterium]MDH5284305.1 cation transporter [Gemmatimonadota bacterium]
MTASNPLQAASRQMLVRRGQRLTWLTLGYNSLESVIALVAGVVAGSIALKGFGVDSVIEVSASAAALWRLSLDADPARRARAERLTHRLIGASFLGLAAFVTWQAADTILTRSAPDESPVGIALAALSLIVMPLLARAKRRIGNQLRSDAIVAESKQTSLCAWLSAILLGGLLLNATLGWWWADPVAAIAMVPIIVQEGVDGLRNKPCCDHCDT